MVIVSFRGVIPFPNGLFMALDDWNTEKQLPRNQSSYCQRMIGESPPQNIWVPWNHSQFRWARIPRDRGLINAPQKAIKKRYPHIGNGETETYLSAFPRGKAALWKNRVDSTSSQMGRIWYVNVLPSQKRTNVPEKGTSSIGNAFSNHWFSGDMLVFRGVVPREGLSDQFHTGSPVRFWFIFVFRWSDHVIIIIMMASVMLHGMGLLCHARKPFLVIFKIREIFQLSIHVRWPEGPY